MVNPIVVAGLLALGVGGLAFALVGGDSRAEKRRAAVAKSDAKALAASAHRRRTARKKQIAEGLRDLERRESGAPTWRPGSSRPDFRSPSSSTGSAARSSASCAAAWPMSNREACCSWLLVALIAAVGLPHLVLARLRIRRINKFIANFPNAIDIIVRGIKSGLPLGDTIRIAANESAEPVKSEFRRVVESLSLGMTLPEGVERMAQRVPIAETNFFSIVIAIQAKAGGNLSEAIGNLSRVLRERKKMKGKIGAMSMEAKASAAIIGAVPFLVVGALYVSSPKYMSLLWTTAMDG